VTLTTGPARLSGAPGFSRLGVFGGDVLKSQVQDPFKNGASSPVAGPNGRRFGDDVVNIGFIALGVAPPSPTFNVNRVDRNDITYNNVFPYAATPHNGRNITRRHRRHFGAAGAGALNRRPPGRAKARPDFPDARSHPRHLPVPTLILPPSQSSDGQ